MNKSFRDAYRVSMAEICFSDAEKTELLRTLTQTTQNRKERKRMMGKRIKRVLISLAAAVMLLGTVTAAAAFAARWSRNFDQGLRASEEERQWAEKSGLAANPGGEKVSASANGVTITAEQTIVDRCFALISFRIEGFRIPEGKDPDVGQLQVTVDLDSETRERASFAWGGAFYDGIVTSSDGQSAYDDGSPLVTHADGSWHKRYYTEDGSLIYELSLSSTAEDVFFGKEIRVSFQSLGYGDKAQYFPLADGPWEMHWTLSGSDAVRTVELNQEIGDSGVTLVEAELSPISVHLVYQTDGIWTGYEQLETFEPRFMGVKLKDGTSYPFLLSGPGSAGYTDFDYCLYESRATFNRLIDPDEVDALLFLNLDSVPVGVTNLRDITEDCLYMVKLNG